MSRFTICLLTLAALPLFADPPQSAIIDAVTDRYRPILFDQEKLGGLLANRMRANSEGYLEHVLGPNSTASKTPATQDLEPPPEPGRVLEAIANAFQYRHDDHLKAVMQQLEKLVIAAQPRDTAAADSPQLLIRKNDVLGLLAYYQATGDDNALDAARRFGDSLIRSFPKTAAHSQYLHAATLIEGLVSLYRYTEDEHYLDFCKSAADAWLQAKDTHNDPSSENLAALHGLVELYRITGDESYFRAVTAAWLEIRNRWLSLSGTPLSNGELSVASDDKNAGDACATLSWVQLTIDLLRVTGDAQYADQLEHTIYNELLAGEDATTGSIFAPAPLNGSKQPASPSDPCLSSEAQAVALLPSAVWGRFGNGIAIVLYSAGRATFQLSHRRGTVQIYSEAAFPESGDFLLHVEPTHNLRFPLRLRVPEWTSQFVVEIRGSHLIGKPGDFLTINREWHRGDTLKVSMDMTVRVIDGAPAYPGTVAIERGPQILALSRALNGRIKELEAATVLASDASRPRLGPVAANLPLSWPGEQAYTVAGEYEGRPENLILVPFADAKTYRVWLKRLAASTGAAKLN